MKATTTPTAVAHPRTLRVAHLRGCDFDEDMWDRVVGHWRLGTDQPVTAFARAIGRVRRALCDRSVELHLVPDGPLLLRVTAVTPAAEPSPAGR